jgi:hypothetical protein
MFHSKKKPSLGRLWISLDVKMVEAAGIEPASASPLPQDLHAYFVYCFNCQLPDEQGTLTAIP